MTGTFTYLLERKKRCKGAQGLRTGERGGNPPTSVGTEGLPAPGRRSRGRAGGPRAAQGTRGPANARPRSLAFPAARARAAAAVPAP